MLCICLSVCLSSSPSQEFVLSLLSSGINDVSSPPGIFIALNLLLVEAEAGKRIDVGLCVQKMLYQRAGMINTLVCQSQYAELIINHCYIS